jgi:hypothetical protein
VPRRIASLVRISTYLISQRPVHVLQVGRGDVVLRISVHKSSKHCQTVGSNRGILITVSVDKYTEADRMASAACPNLPHTDSHSPVKDISQVTVQHLELRFPILDLCLECVSFVTLGDLLLGSLASRLISRLFRTSDHRLGSLCNLADTHANCHGNKGSGVTNRSVLRHCHWVEPGKEKLDQWGSRTAWWWWRGIGDIQDWGIAEQIDKGGKEVGQVFCHSLERLGFGDERVDWGLSEKREHLSVD